MSESRERTWREVPRAESEKKEFRLADVWASVDRKFRAVIDQAGDLTIDHQDYLRSAFRAVAEEVGMKPEHVQVAVAEIQDVSTESVLQLSEKSTAAPRKERKVSGSARHVALLGVLMTGCGAEELAPTSRPLPVPQSYVLYEAPPKSSGPKVIATGSPELDEGLVDLELKKRAREIAKIKAPDCGPNAPKHAPSECGVQQWKGFSETNPAAVAWLAIANTGAESCTVKITRLELSYQSPTGQREVLTRAINGAQLLADGTDGKYWGMHLHDLAQASTFELPPNLHAYVHPFGPMVAVPEDAKDLAVTFAAEITKSCVVGGGIDTYEEFDIPHTDPPYTQNGSETDFIKEAMKTPWVSQTIDPAAPVSFTIERKPRSERTGWYRK